MRILIFTAVAMASPALAQPLFPNSVASNDLDFITAADPTAFVCVDYIGTDRREMPDKRTDALFADGVHIFEAAFNDLDVVPLWLHPDIGTAEDARAIAEEVATAVGRLPIPMREALNHVVIHSGDETAFAEDAGQFFVLYSDNIATRIANNDLEETVFHESVHATLDIPHASSPDWRAAQEADGTFITDYAAQYPDKEDFAESALFAWALLMHPGRLPEEIETLVRQVMPNRLAFFEALLAEASDDADLLVNPVQRTPLCS
ncbi:hypothetical protein ACG74X_01085 [Marivita sp. S0852]|uniref:hypothetical protein n=1 Tax=Marivita sp. S0852 TaxID=3373893 RepID=UPI0039825F3C